MLKRSNQVDLYILKAAPFAQPILNHLRELVHIACPDVEEKLKWSFPHFDYLGNMMCSMAGFKHHCVFGFWKASIMEDKNGIFSEKNAMGQLGKIKSLADLPSDRILLSYIKQAAKLNKEGTNLPAKKKIEPKKLEVPDYFIDALKEDKYAWDTFHAFTPGQKREYVMWVTGAKTESTRNKRMYTAIEWMAEGKIRNWKYVKK